MSAVAHMHPFRDSHKEYRAKGWFGTLPLPPKKKNPPPTGFTGRSAPWPDEDKLREWLTDPKHQRANICLRLGGVDAEYEVVGIDVDNYIKGEKVKKGGEQLEALENAHGRLPDTWVSTSRTDGISGKRFYRVPRGLAFRGQVDKDIECLQKGHRFALIWPSFNPDSAATETWFPPGTPLTEEGRKVWDGVIPDARTLPLLPDSWIDYLTRGRMEAGKVEIDMDSSVDVIYEWAYDHFGTDQPICFRMREKMETHLGLIRNEATSHDKITNAHYNLIRLAAEGHRGWDSALHEMEQVYVDECQTRDKRSAEELRGEIFRSRINALRKVKAQVDAQLSIGASGVPERDLECGDGTDYSVDVLGASTGDGTTPPPNNLSDVPAKASRPADEYRQNDDGNAEHFLDIWSNEEVGPAVRFVEGYGWIVWHAGDGKDKRPHWELDPDGNGLMRQMFWRVRDKQEDFTEQRYVDWQNEVAAFAAGNSPSVTAASVRDAKSVYGSWKKFSEASGNNRNAAAAIQAIKSHAGINVKLESLDADPNLLGVSNGVVELGPDGPTLRDAKPDDLVTLNTGVPWLPGVEISATGQRLWDSYLDKFLPDREYRLNVQIILGHALIGGNPHKKLIIFKGASNTGKSVMVSMLNEVLGDYAKTTNKSLFTYHKLNPVLAAALPKRLVSITELSSDGRNPLTVDQMKTATGNDYIEVELKNSNVSVNRVPFFLPIMVTNVVPQIEGHDNALRERIRVIEFKVVEPNPDDTIAAIMRTESRTAVLNWLIEGYAMYCQTGRKFPTSVDIDKATDEFVSEFDEAGQFVYEMVRKHPKMNSPMMNWSRDAEDWCVSRTALHSAYVSWCALNDDTRHQLNSRKFTSRMRELGFFSPDAKARVNGRPDRYWFGIQLTKPESMLDNPAGITFRIKGEDT